MASGIHGDGSERRVTLAGTLYIVATPIGNLEDITLRALRVLREVGVIAAEDTRRTRQLLARHAIETPLVSYREQNRASATPRLLERLERGSVALVSDAGMPGIADPGAALVAAVVRAGGRVEALPGPTAVVTALVASGLRTAPFTFVGFLSRQRGDRRRQLQDLAERRETLVFYEAPHRVVETLREMQGVLGEREAAVCRELTKRHEEIRRGAIGDLLAHFETEMPRGEFTLVVEGLAPTVAVSAHNNVALTEANIDILLMSTLHNNTHNLDIKHLLHNLSLQSGLPRRTLYTRWQALRRQKKRGSESQD